MSCLSWSGVHINGCSQLVNMSNMAGQHALNVLRIWKTFGKENEPWKVAGSSWVMCSTYCNVHHTKLTYLIIAKSCHFSMLCCYTHFPMLYRSTLQLNLHVLVYFFQQLRNGLFGHQNRKLSLNGTLGVDWAHISDDLL